MAEQIRIAQVIGNAKTGGVISCVLNFYRNIDRGRFRFDFFTYGKSPFDEEIRALGGEIYTIPNVLFFPKAISVMKRFFKKGGYDAVHAHMTTLSPVALCAAYLAGIRTRIAHAHSTTHKTEKVRIVKNVLRLFSRVFPTEIAGCSRYSCKWLYGRKKGEEAFLLRNAIDLTRFVRDDFKSATLRKKYGLSEQKVVGFVGRFVYQKNVPFLVEAFAMLALERKDCTLVLAGDGKDRPEIEKLIEKYKLEDRVLILPEIKDVQNYYALFDVFALPSRYEGLPLVAVEAQAMGIPCLLSDEITREADLTGQCRFLPIDSTGYWADQLALSLSLPKYNGHEAVAKAGYDIRQEVKRLEAFYTEAVR
jgi:glycosyltransferase EpsF